MTELHRFHFHAAEQAGATPQPGFNSDEAAARFHLSHLLEADSRPALRTVTAPDRAARVPDLRLQSAQTLPQTHTTLVSFSQAKDDIPIFGAKTVCELGADRELVSAGGRVARVRDVSSFPTVSMEDARAAIARFAGVDAARLDGIAPGKLHFYEDDADDWHLVYLFAKVPAAPPQMLEHSKGHGLGGSPRSLAPLVDYLVDAHSAEVVLHFSATPLLTVPTKGSGVGEDGATVEFWGQQLDGRFVLSDPLREIKTYDLEGGDLDSAVLRDPFGARVAHLGDGARAVVSAHANATRVYDFVKGVLLRDGIDDLGMELINVVNCTYSASEAPPSWHNAVWYQDRMWYGQAPGSEGRLESYSRHLDVIAHELSHGLTQFTADLVYKDQPGALNESFSDIFGIVIKNWDPQDPGGGDASGWSWRLGDGLSAGGGPLRDLSDPRSTGDPAHMDEYVHTPYDEGGVHINSNIHNKAAYNVLTCGAFTPREVAYLYYLALMRLGRLDGFSDALDALVTVAMTYYGGDPAERDGKVGALRGAYGAVGIR